MRMSVKGHLALLVGVFVVALLGVALVQWDLAGDAGAAARDLIRRSGRGLRLGAHDYLRKPFEPSELLARVHAAVRSKALQDELRLRNAELELACRTDVLTGLSNRRRRRGPAGGGRAAPHRRLARRRARPLGRRGVPGRAAGHRQRRGGRPRRADPAGGGGRDRVMAGPAAGSRPFTLS
jgi:hypothetical protein